jgi:hypothetical protein
MGERKSGGQRNEWRERRRLKQSDGEQRPKSMSYEEDHRDACAQNGAQAKLCSKGVQTIGYTPGNRSAYQAHCGSPAKHDPEFLGPEPASRKKGRQEGRDTSKRTEKCAVQQHKPKKRDALLSWICGSRARSPCRLSRRTAYLNSARQAGPHVCR